MKSSEQRCCRKEGMRLQRLMRRTVLWTALLAMLSFSAGCGTGVSPSRTPQPQHSAAPTKAPLERISEQNRFQLENPQNFVLGTPKEGQMTAVEARRRYEEFCTALIGMPQTATVIARYYADCSGAREDYWLLRCGTAGGLDLAVSADTGQLLGCRNTVRCDAMLPPSGCAPKDWKQEDDAHLCCMLRDAIEKLSDEELVEDVYIGSIWDGGCVSLVAAYADGREAAFLLRFEDDAVLLQRVEVTCQGAVDRWTVPWLADVLFVDPSNGSVREVWLSGRGVTDLFKETE